MNEPDPSRASPRDESAGGVLLNIVSNTTRDRLELIRLEFEEEKRKYLGLAVWIGIAVIGGMHGALLTSLVIIYLTPPELRPVVAIAVACVNWLLVAWAAIRIRSLLRETNTPFETTLEQLRKDLECFNTGE